MNIHSILFPTDFSEYNNAAPRFASTIQSKDAPAKEGANL
jgi:hypothetical protein